MKGYTIIEVIIALLLLSIILLGGTTLFYQNLRSSGLSDVDLNLNSSLRALLSGVENDIRFSQVTSVGAGDRDDCLNAGVTGYSGDSLTVKDLNGLDATYFLDTDFVSSRSGQTSTEVRISPTGVVISDLGFIWYCRAGISDKLKIEIEASSSVFGSGVSVTRSVSREINLFNSGIN